MRKKRLCVTLGCLISVAALCIWGYKAMSDYVKTRFAPNTWVDGIYVTGLTPEEVNQELLARLEAPVVTVVDSNGETYSLDMTEAECQYDYSNSLNAYQAHQKDAGWVSMLWQENQIVTGQASFAYDEGKVRTWWENLPIVQAETKKPVLELRLDKEKGYVLDSTLEGHLDVDKGLTELVKIISEGETSLSLPKTDCYYDYNMTAAQKQIYNTWEDLKKMEQCGLTYDMGAEKIVFDEALMSGFIAKDEKGNPLRDEEGSFYYDFDAVDAYVTELCESYHTYGVDRPFRSSREGGEIVTVPGGTYGTELDVKAEVSFVREYLSDDMLRLSETVHMPKYKHETPVKGLDDIGGTYIEVDMTEQKIYYYKDYELMVSSGVVTGNLRTRHDTPAGAFYIYGMYKNRVLRGPGYASFVRRWMPIYKSIGLHDANWRTEEEFGGETYKKNGSHGCINMPDETTDVIFDNAEIGTPVLVFE